MASREELKRLPVMGKGVEKVIKRLRGQRSSPSASGRSGGWGSN